MNKVSLIYKVLSGEASAAEQKELADWVDETPGNREEFEDIKLLWTTTEQADGGDSPLSDGFDKIKARVRAGVRRRRWFKAIGKTVVIIVFGLAAFFLLHHSERWLPGAQNFELQDVALEEAIGVIDDRYNIRIEVEDRELLQRHITLVVYEVKHWQDVVESLAEALNVEVTAVSRKRYKLIEAGGNGNVLKLRK